MSVPGSACHGGVPVPLQVCGVLLCVPGTACFLACRFRCKFMACCWSVPPCRVSGLACCSSVPGILLLRFGVLFLRAWLLLCLLRFDVLILSVPGSYCVYSGLACFVSVPGSYPFTFFFCSSGGRRIRTASEPCNGCRGQAIFPHFSAEGFPDLLPSQAQNG